MVVSVRVLKVSDFWGKLDKLTDEVEPKELELQNMLGLVAETAMVGQQTANLREVSKKVEANVAVLDGLQEEVLAVKKAVAELFAAAEKVRDVRLDTVKKVRSPETELRMHKHEEAQFEGTMNAVSKDFSAARV